MKVFALMLLFVPVLGFSQASSDSEHHLSEGELSLGIIFGETSQGNDGLPPATPDGAPAGLQWASNVGVQIDGRYFPWKYFGFEGYYEPQWLFGSSTSHSDDKVEWDVNEIGIGPMARVDAGTFWDGWGKTEIVVGAGLNVSWVSFLGSYTTHYSDGTSSHYTVPPSWDHSSIEAGLGYYFKVGFTQAVGPFKYDIEWTIDHPRAAMDNNIMNEVYLNFALRFGMALASAL